MACKAVCLGVGAAILALLGFEVVQLDLLKRVETGIPAEWHCEAAFKDQVTAAEDITMVAPGVFLASSDDRLKLWEHPSFGPSRTPDGEVLAIYGPDGEGQFKVESVELEGFPWDAVAFHPHGVFFHRPSSSLYTINHAYMRGGERIEVFKVTLGADNKVSLRYARSVVSPLFDAEAMGNLNDLVVLGGEGQEEEEIYVTHYRAFPDGAQGRLSSSVMARVHDHLTLLAMLTHRPWTRLLYCKGSTCRPAEGDNGGIAFNGISASPDNRRLLVADTKSVVVFEITGPGVLRRIQVLQTPHFIDNIEPSPDGPPDESYTMASIGYIYEFLRHNSAYAQQPQGERPSHTPPVAGGAMSLTRDPITGLYRARDLIMTDGRSLSLISCAVKVGSTHLLMGAWGSRGLLICHWPRDPAGGAREGGGRTEL